MSLSNLNKDIQSPFKFLDSFELKDKDYFFGRNKEIDLLYDYVNKNRLVMVYGESGTGKTSLVQCGLASRFDITDWYPIFIKRGENINDSLDKALTKASKGQYDGDILKGLKKINTRSLRPVFLVFDQLEELLILGDAEKREEKKFIRTISNILDTDQLSCNIILIIRNEYLAQLYNFEKSLPFLFDRRLHVEPMSFDRVSEVIIKSCKSFNITLENPQTNIKRIVDNISGGKSRIPLPYLQVYMDMFYREDMVRTYEKDIPKEEFPHLDFTTKEIKDFGTIKNVLEKFLIEQEQELYSELLHDFPEAKEGTVRKILDTFVTEDGTKKALSFIIKEEIIKVTEKAPDYLRGLTPSLLAATLSSLENRRILRSSESTFELAHDSLAELIDKNRSNEQRLINQYKIRIKNAYEEFNQSGEYLRENQLISIEEYQSKLDIDATYEQFLKKSWEDVKQKKKVEREQKVQKSIAEEKASMAQKTAKLAQQRTRNRTAFLIVVALLSLVLALGAFRLYRTSQKLSLQITETKISNANTLKNQGAFNKATEVLSDASEDASADQKLRINRLISKLSTLDSLVTNGDLLFKIATDSSQTDKFPQALDFYEQAYQRDTSIKVILQTRNEIQYRIEVKYLELKKSAMEIYDRDGCKYAVPIFKDALQLNQREAPYINGILNDCENKKK